MDQRETARSYTASALGNGTPSGGLSPDNGQRNWRRLRGAEIRPPQAAAIQPETPAGPPAPDVPADPPRSAE